MPRICSSTHLPRLTGEVRVGFDVRVKTPACVRTPPRLGGSFTRRTRARYTFDAVKLRQPPVHETEVGVDQVENAAILAEDRLEEQLGLADHRRTQLVVEAGKLLGIGSDVGQFSGRQPLTREVLHEGGRLRIREHPPHLGVEVLPQLPPGRQGEQLVVGHAAPEKVRQPRGQLVLADLVARSGARPGGSSSTRKRKSGQTRTRFESDADTVLEPLAFLLGSIVELEQAFDFLGPDRAAEGPVGEPGDDLAGGLARWQAGLVGQQPLVGLGQHRRRGVVRTVQRDAADDQHALMLVRVDRPEWVVSLLLGGGFGLLGLFARLRRFGIRIEEGDRDVSRTGFEPNLRLDPRRSPIASQSRRTP